MTYSCNHFEWITGIVNVLFLVYGLKLGCTPSFTAKAGCALDY
uniref:Uncharacterized protein n=1 Tax=Rhizophora mucronata TaxID=61149 RepID=A0A2P2PG40_RHIMU